MVAFLEYGVANDDSLDGDDKGNRAPEELGREIGRVTTAGFASYWGSSNK